MFSHIYNIIYHSLDFMYAQMYKSKCRAMLYMGRPSRGKHCEYCVLAQETDSLTLNSLFNKKTSFSLYSKTIFIL